MTHGRGVLIALALAAGALAAGAPSALADSKDATCTTLQEVLANANAGDVITVTDASCSGRSYFLKDGVNITLQGASGTGTVFDGNDDANDPILSGVDNGYSTFRNMTFQNSSIGGNGAGVSLTGNTSPTFDSVSFFGNSAGPSGGGLYIQATAAVAGTIVIQNSTFGATDRGNSANNGGGLFVSSLTHAVTLSNDHFTANQVGSMRGGGAEVLSTAGLTVQNSVFDTNKARNEGRGLGGGLYAEVSPSATLTGNTFTNNHAGDFGGAGGGVYLIESQTAEAPVTVTQGANLFLGNQVIGGTGGSSVHAGGGELVSGNLTSTADEFIGNSLPASPVALSASSTPSAPSLGFNSEGGGLAIVQGPVGPTTASLRNLVATGNTIGSGGEGGGIYAGGPSPVELDLLDSTVAGNTIAPGGGGSNPDGGPGIDGGPSDSIKLYNSIVATNGGPNADLQGFGTRDVRFSDSCAGTGLSGGPLPGPGNICADPLLVSTSTGDARETASSPTIDAGSSSLVPPDLVNDFDGTPRIQGPSVDIGADEADLRPTVTSVSCAPPSVTLGARTTCTVTVADSGGAARRLAGITPLSTPTGAVALASSGPGSFLPGPGCTLSGGGAPGTASCAVTYGAGVAGTHGPTGSYGGDRNHAGSTGRGTLTAIAPGAAGAVPTTGIRQAHACISRRHFAIRIAHVTSRHIVKAQVIVRGRTVRVVRGARLRAAINLRGLPRDVLHHDPGHELERARHQRQAHLSHLPAQAARPQAPDALIAGRPRRRRGPSCVVAFTTCAFSATLRVAGQ